jgi:hypothetical protein
MTEKLHTQFAVSAIFHTADNAPLNYEPDVIRPGQPTHPRFTIKIARAAAQGLFAPRPNTTIM